MPGLLGQSCPHPLHAWAQLPAPSTLADPPHHFPPVLTHINASQARTGCGQEAAKNIEAALSGALLPAAPDSQQAGPLQDWYPGGFFQGLPFFRIAPLAGEGLLPDRPHQPEGDHLLSHLSGGVGRVGESPGGLFAEGLQAQDYMEKQLHSLTKSQATSPPYLQVKRQFCLFLLSNPSEYIGRIMGLPILADQWIIYSSLNLWSKYVHQGVFLFIYS